MLVIYIDVPMHAEGSLKYKRQSSVSKRARHILSVLSDAKNMETQLECLTDLCQVLHIMYIHMYVE